MTGWWRGIAEKMRQRKPRTAVARPVIPHAQAENELAQLRSIRDDAQRVAPGSQLHAWCNGAIFALEWARDPEQHVRPSVPAGQVRVGMKVEL